MREYRTRGRSVANRHTYPGDIRGAAQLKIGTELLIQGERRGTAKPARRWGLSCHNPDRVRWPGRGVHRVQVIAGAVVARRLSGNDSRTGSRGAEQEQLAPELEAKVREYLAAGVELVWVADPDAGTVAAHRSNQPAHLYGATDMLTADPIIPGLAVPVTDLFR